MGSDGQNGLRQRLHAGLRRRGGGVAALGRGDDLQGRVALFTEPDDRHRAAHHREVLHHGHALVEHEQRLHPARLEQGGGCLRPGPAGFFVLAADEDHRPLRLEALRRQGVGRFEHHHQGALVVDRAPAPHGAVGNLAGEGRVFPVAFGPGGHRHHVLVAHQDDRRQRRVRSLPGVDERPVGQDLAGHRRVGGRIGRGQPGVELVPLGPVVLVAVLVADRQDLHGLGQVQGGLALIDRRGAGDLDRRQIDLGGRLEGRGPYGDDPAQQRHNTHARQRDFRPGLHAILPDLLLGGQ